jgi:hypothetical protein
MVYYLMTDCPIDILFRYKKAKPDGDYSGEKDPGVASVKKIYNYLCVVASPCSHDMACLSQFVYSKQHDYKT